MPHDFDEVVVAAVSLVVCRCVDVPGDGAYRISWREKLPSYGIILQISNTPSLALRGKSVLDYCASRRNEADMQPLLIHDL